MDRVFKTFPTRAARWRLEPPVTLRQRARRETRDDDAILKLLVPATLPAARMPPSADGARQALRR